MPADFLRPLVTGWLGKIEQARRAREPWLEIANECLMFFSNAKAFWDSRYASKYWDMKSLPRFQIVMNRAFEMVATFGPSLFFESPHRSCKTRRRAPVNPQFFLPPGAPPDHPQVQQMLQQIQMQEQMDEMRRHLAADLMQDWLNYTPWEAPGKGLSHQAQLAIQDALITGRGVLRAGPHAIPGSQQIVTGAMRINPKRIFGDSDFNTVEEWRWMAIETTAPYWEVERKFQLKAGSLRHACTLESEYSRGERQGDPWTDSARKSGKTNDLITYYEIFSKTGPGGRLAGMETAVRDHLENVVGDYAYLALCKNCPYPLNAPTERFQMGATDQDVAQMFAWPIETWRDSGRWPVEFLDFYPHPESAYPVAPLAPGLGELKFLNIMMSHLANRIWSSSRDFIAVIESAMKTVEDTLRKGDDLTIISVPPIFQDIRQMISFIQQPQVNFDVWKILEAVSEQFDRRTGLSAILFAQNPDGTQSRTAQDAASKRQAAGVRPAYMQKIVRTWMNGVSRVEAIASHAFIRGKDVVGVMGPMRAQLWDQMVASNSMEQIAREFEYTVAAADMRPPDKDRDAANVGQAMSMVGPILSQYAMATTNTQPFNELIRLWGEAADMDVTALQMGQWMPPPPPPEAMQMQQASGQLGVQQQAADVEKTYAEINKIEADTKTTLQPPKDPNKQQPPKKAA